MTDPVHGSNSRRKITLQMLAGVLLVGIFGLVLISELTSLRKGETGLPELGAIIADAETRSDRSAGNGARTISRGTNGEPAKLLITAAAIRDAEMILEHPIPEFFMVYQILTNSGVPPDLTKSTLRLILHHVVGVSHNNRMLASDAANLSSMMDATRNDPELTKKEKVMTLVGLGATYEQFRLRITARCDEHLHKLSEIVNQLGAKDPEGLLRKILWAEPPDFPPAPTE